MKNFLGNDFNEFYDYAANLTKKQKGDLFEELTYHLFKLDPRLNANLEKIWLHRDIPEKIFDELGQPDEDRGIDLLAKINGDYYAIQSKFRQDTNKVITWTELSTFFGLSFGINDKIKHGFFVTNTYNLCDEVINSTKVTPIYADFFESLPADFFESIRKDVTKVKYIKKKPRQHQQACIINCLFHYVDFHRGFIEMACGTGKTLASYWIDKGLYNKQTVIFVPSLQLLSQFYTDWINQSYAEGVKINYLLVGSDADIDEEIKYKSNGVILYTEPKLIRKYIESVSPNEKLVVISTYQSADKLAKACTGMIFDFGIFDESHKTVGQAGKKFSLMLTNNHMVINKRLFMTATPKIYNGDLDSDEVISMDNKNIYGEKIFRYSTGEAIEDKRLVDYKVISLYTKNVDIEKTITKNKLVKYKKEFEDLEANYLGIIILLLKKIHDGTCKHLITYHNKITHAKKFAEILEKINVLLYGDDNKLSVGYLSGKTPMRRRNRIIKDFAASEKSVMCSARVLNEGVDIPIVDSVCFVDPRFSTSDIIQCIGRALRLFEGKTMANIIVPIFIDNFEDDFDKNAHGNVIRILKSLKTTDDDIVGYFKLKKVGKKSGGRQIVVNEYFDELNYSKEIDLDEWNKEIKDQIWKVTDGWDFKYEKVKEWIEQNDRIPSTNNKNIIENELGIWCSQQRNYKRHGKMDKDRIKKLECLPKWKWELLICNKIGMFLPENEKFRTIKPIKYLGDNFKIFNAYAEINNELYVFKIVSRIIKNKNGQMNYRYNLITKMFKKDCLQEMKLLEKLKYDLIHYCFIIAPIEKNHDCIYYWGKIPKIKKMACSTINISPQDIKKNKYEIYGTHSWQTICNELKI